jgi:ABC-2 type transport system permease protein
MSAATDYLPPSMPKWRTVGVYVNEARFECLRIFRSPAFVVAVIVMPLAFYLLLGVALRDLRHQGGPHALGDAAIFVSFAIYGVLAPGLVVIAMQLATERSLGVLAYKRALPMPPASYIAAKILSAHIFAVIIMALLTALAVTLGGVQVERSRLIVLAGIMALGVAPGCAMGLLIAAAFPPGVANALASTVFITMVMLAGLFYPLPPLLEAMRPIWPAYHLQQLGLAAFGLPSHGDPSVHVLILVAATALFSALAAWRLARLR